MWLPFTGFGAMGLVLIGTRKKNRRRLATFAILTLALMGVLLSGCGGHKSTPGTPTGAFTVTATATNGAGVAHSTTFTLTVQ